MGSPFNLDFDPGACAPGFMLRPAAQAQSHRSLVRTVERVPAAVLDTFGKAGPLRFVNPLIQTIPESICLAHPLRFTRPKVLRTISNVVPEERR